MAAVLVRTTGAELELSGARTTGPNRTRRRWRRAAIRGAVLKGAALPELGALAAVLARPGAELGAALWPRAAHSAAVLKGTAQPISAAVLKGAAQPIPPPF
jgi:hypothetical protein